MALTGMVGAVLVTDPTKPLQAFTDEPMGRVDDRHYAIADRAFAYWPHDPAEAEIVVKIDGTTITSGYLVNPAGGEIIFTAPVDLVDEVTVSGNAITLMQAGGMFNWSIDLDGDDADATTYASAGWKEFVRTLNGWSGSAEAYWGDTYFYEQLGKPVLVELYVDAGASKRHVAGYVIINGDSIETPVEGLVQESVEFTGTGALIINL